MQKVELDIADFLPIYPHIKGKDVGKDTFNQSIYTRKEFYDERLASVEHVPPEAGTLMKHQKIIARFMSSYTPYDQILFFHEMGSGKTCTAIGAIEQIRREKNGIVGAIVLARGEGLINNFINELVFKCTKGQYIPDDFENLTELEKIHRVKKEYQTFYILDTFEMFAKKISKTPDSEIKRRYSNHVIVFDEIHNIRTQYTTGEDEEGGEKVKLDIYKQFWRLTHLVDNCKIILMSGTPVKDDPSELASVMNLILPANEQLPQGAEFTKQFLHKDRDGYITITENMSNVLANTVRGRISFLKSMQSDVRRVFKGELVGKLRHLNVVPDIMGEFQSKIYREAYSRDSREKGVYSYSRQASLFVFPDGTYGPDGFNNRQYISHTAIRAKLRGAGVNVKSISVYSLGPDLVKNIRVENDKEKTLERLGIFSSKYAATIRQILEAQRAGKTSFVYSEFVKGSGAILFSSLLTLFGFARANGKETEKGLRYAIVTNTTTTQAETKNIIKLFNRPENMHGEYISVVIGSSVISEGYSLKNVQSETILTPWFNYSETSQAIARGLRLGSHNDLVLKGETPVVDIYQRVSLPDNIDTDDRVKSIDLEMYEMSEVKDVNIKKLERILRKASVDCALNYRRNHVEGYDKKRDCDYMDCNYSCDGISPGLVLEELPDSELNTSTYQLYYSSENVEKIAETVVKIFRTNFKLGLEVILNFLSEQYTEFDIITALRSVINNNIVIINKYGFNCYLREEDNIFFLVDSLSVEGNILTENYTQKPNIRPDITFAKIVDTMYYDSLPNMVDKLQMVTEYDEFRKLIHTLPTELQETFLEGSILSQKLGAEINIILRDFVLEYFKDSYKEFDGVWVVWLSYEKTDSLRCLEGTVWEECNKKYVDILVSDKEKIEDNVKLNKYGYYGKYNKNTDAFCIVEVDKQADKQPDKRKEKTGRVCATSLNKPDLLNLIVNRFKIDPLKIVMPTASRAELENTISRIRIMKNIFPDLKSATDEDLHRGIYWNNQRIIDMCSTIQKWMRDNGILLEDSNCGEGPAKK